MSKSKLNNLEAFLISKVLIDSNISHDEFALVNIVLKEFYDMKECIKQCYRIIVWSVEKLQKVKIQKL